MKSLSITASLFLLICLPMLAQNATPAKPPQGGAAQSQSDMPAGIEITLRKYISAYERRSMQELLVVWPDLQSDKKEFGTIKKHFDDGNVSNEHVSLHPLETQALKDDVIVKCERTEQFAKAQTLDSGGDLMMGRSPAQNSGPSPTTKDVKKKENIWMKLHKRNDDWVIVAVSGKKLSF